MRILVLNGPNLNLLGRREVSLYGAQSLLDIEDELRSWCVGREIDLDFFQSNCEGSLVDRIQAAADSFDGIIFNPGGLTHTSVSLLDALLAVGLPGVEVHVTNLARRAEFRRDSVTVRGQTARVEGFGSGGYLLALQGLLQLLESDRKR